MSVRLLSVRPVKCAAESSRRKRESSQTQTPAHLHASMCTTLRLTSDTLYYCRLFMPPSTWKFWLFASYFQVQGFYVEEDGGRSKRTRRGWLTRRSLMWSYTFSTLLYTTSRFSRIRDALVGARKRTEKETTTSSLTELPQGQTSSHLCAQWKETVVLAIKRLCGG